MKASAQFLQFVVAWIDQDGLSSYSLSAYNPKYDVGTAQSIRGGHPVRFEELQAKLRDPDQWVRVEALRILAMVEETRAIRDIEWVFKNDPEPGVRQIAQWAGRIVFAALKQQNRPQADANAPRAVEEAFLNSLIDKDHRTYEAMQNQMMQHELRDAVRSSMNDQRELPPPSPLPVSPPPEISRKSSLDPWELLDAGLSSDFFEGMHDA